MEAKQIKDQSAEVNDARRHESMSELKTPFTTEQTIYENEDISIKTVKVEGGVYTGGNYQTHEVSEENNRSIFYRISENGSVTAQEISDTRITDFATDSNTTTSLGEINRNKDNTYTLTYQIMTLKQKSPQHETSVAQ